MTNPIPVRVGGISERALSAVLFVKYALLALYGVGAAAVEVPTFVIVGSPMFALAWAIGLTLTALLAMTGVMRSWRSGHHRMERFTTAAFILVFMLYSSALVVRAIQTGEWASAGLALIPPAVCALPTFRFYDLVLRKPA